MNPEHPLAYAEQGMRDTAQRIVNAENEFVKCLMMFGGITSDQAEHVLRLYIALKMVKLDAVGGRYTVKHGGYFDKDVIGRAVDTPVPVKKTRKAKA